MTAIVGILCKDGVVIGSDSASTFAAANQLTIEQTTKKCSIIKDTIICGAGAVGLNQRFQEIVNKKWEDISNNHTSPILACVDLANETLKNFDRTAINSPNINFACLLGFVLDGQAHLCEFEILTFQPEIKSIEGAWYVSLGSGQGLTDPFLGFVNKVFWNNEQPNLKEGIYGAIWALEHVINLNTGGVNGPIQIVTLSIDDNGLPQTKLFNEQELAEHKEYVSNFEKEIKEIKNKLNNAQAAQIPPSPTITPQESSLRI